MANTATLTALSFNLGYPDPGTARRAYDGRGAGTGQAPKAAAGA